MALVESLYLALYRSHIKTLPPAVLSTLVYIGFLFTEVPVILIVMRSHNEFYGSDNQKNNKETNMIALITEIEGKQQGAEDALV